MIRAPWVRLTSGPTIGLRELVRTDVFLELFLPIVYKETKNMHSYKYISSYSLPSTAILSLVSGLRKGLMRLKATGKAFGALTTIILLLLSG